MTKNIAIILSGCGYIDGAEINESVISALEVDRYGCNAEFFAPDIMQKHTVNHISGDEESNNRNVINESARICRGKISPIGDLQVDKFDALLIPGGFGVAKNLSSLAFDGINATINADFANIIKSFYNSNKPIGAICIAPAVLALVMKDESRSPIKLTIGEDADTAALINQAGHEHIIAASDEFVWDADNKIASCSAFMREDRISLIATGISKVVEKIVIES